MSNFDFLKNFNKELYEIGLKLEDDVIESPRAVTADATQFLENLVKDIYKLSNNKLENHLISFYKKIDNLYRSGVISYIYKNKLQDAYNLRNRIHKNIGDDEEEKLALDLHERLFYISKKYFQDFCADEKYITVPEYRKPEFNDVKFTNCIICGSENLHSVSNICDECNKKIEYGNFLTAFRNKHEGDTFKRHDLIKMGISEGDSISLLRDLSKEDLVINNGEFYIFNEENFKLFISDIDEYIKISLLLTKFYKDEIKARDIKFTEEYFKGSNNQKPFAEFFRLVNDKIERDFERDLLNTENIKKALKNNSMDNINIEVWFNKQKLEFSNGKMNDAFILYNELLIKEFFKLKRKGYSQNKVFKELNLSAEVYDFWQDEFMGDDFLKTTNDIKKELIISKIRNNKTLRDAIKAAGISRDEFDKLYLLSKSADDDFYKTFEREYTQKRKKLFIKHLRNNNLNSTIRLTKITKSEFLQWYKDGEITYSEFYLKTTEILMNRYLLLRKNGWKKTDILKHIGISRQLFQSWFNHDDLVLFTDFYEKNNEITSNLVKRGRLINALKEGKNKQEAIFDAGLTPSEFLKIYEDSKKEKTNFHIRFDEEWVENRKRLFVQLIAENDFYNAVEKCEISQIDFNKWYLQDQDRYLSEMKPTEFYLKTTSQLMTYYIQARRNGKNKPDSARSVGLSNIIINKWLNHKELSLFADFAKKEKQMTIDLISQGFEAGKSKGEVSEIFDIPVNVVDEFINKGKSGLKKYKEISDLYEESVIPHQLEVFLEEYKTKSFNKALKNSKLTKEELNYYYKIGQSGDGSFKKFHDDFLSLKKSIYIDNIISKKSSKIALKNSYLTKSEFEQYKSEIEEEILVKRLAIVSEEVTKSKANGLKISKKLGITLNEFYSWFLKGQRGEKYYTEFYIMVCLCFVYPRVVTFNKSLELGIPKNWLLKKLKKDIGPKDYKMWMDNNLLDIQFDPSIIEDDEFKNRFEILNNFIKNNSISIEGDDEMGEIFNSSKGGSIISKTIIKYGDDGEKVIKKTIVGK